MSEANACKQALAAACDALEKRAKVNAERVSAPMAEIDCEIVLDAGSLMYGKVGSARRLDFTVTGPTLNEVVRLETLCSALLGQLQNCDG